jgi:hypothetical protein
MQSNTVNCFFQVNPGHDYFVVACPALTGP